MSAFAWNASGNAAPLRLIKGPHTELGQSWVIYNVQSASVDWTVSGSVDVGGGCVITYSGSGSAQATNDIPVTSQVTIEDVRTNPFAPSPEPQPYYYSIAATGDGADPPPYNTHSSCSPGDFSGATAVTYLGIGSPGPYSSTTPPERVEKTGNLTQLAGHYTGPDSTAIYQVDSTWTFTGSG